MVNKNLCFWSVFFSLCRTWFIIFTRFLKNFQLRLKLQAFNWKSSLWWGLIMGRIFISKTVFLFFQAISRWLRLWLIFCSLYATYFWFAWTPWSAQWCRTITWNLRLLLITHGVYLFQLYFSLISKIYWCYIIFRFSSKRLPI